jgi:hypothetical protein
MQVRVARHTNRLAKIVPFYRDGLGLREIGHFKDTTVTTGSSWP